MAWASAWIPSRRLVGRSFVAVVVIASVVSGGVVSAADGTLPTCPDPIGGPTFTDLGGLSDEAVRAIECVAHHAVSRGTSTSTFSPFDQVPRWQMALFLQRTAPAIRVALPLVTASPFSDVGDLPPQTRLAIDQVAAAGIVNGTAPSTFDPMSDVPRWQMALFLERLLDRSDVPPSTGAVRFTDLDGVPAESVDAIAKLDSIGIVRGTGNGRFEPWSHVTRWEMAVFLSRVLEARDADPLDIEIDLSRDSASYVGGVIATITVSKPNGDPFPGVLVDVFVAESFAPDGSCRLDVEASVNGGDPGTSDDCSIDIGDPRSDSSGHITVGLAHAHVTETDTIYAWAGDLGEAFDADTVTTFTSADLEWVAAPSQLNFSGPDAATFGDVAAFTAQLVGAGSGELLHFEVERNGLSLFTYVTATGSSGGASWTYHGPSDPSSGDDLPVIDTVTAFWDRNGNGTYDGPAEFRSVRTVTWDDAP